MKATIIKTYDATVKEYVAHEFENPSMEKHYKTFLSLIPKKSKILDAGCGPGQAAKNFSVHHKVTGIDLSKKMILAAKRNAPKAKFKVMDVEKILLNEKFDAIWAAFILVHIPREKHLSILKKFYSLLNSKGILYLGMLEGKGEKTMPEPYNRKYTQHFIFVSKQTLEKNLRLANFKLLTYATERFDEEGDIFTLSSAFARKL